MKEPTDREFLLGEILEDALPPGSRARMLDQTLAAVRRRRRARLAINMVGPIALAITVLLLWKGQQRPAIAPAEPAYAWVTSRPLATGQLIETRNDSVTIVSSRPGGIGLITDRTGPDEVRLLDDQALLDLLAGKNAAIVHEAPGEADLIFANPEDLNGFLVRQ